jgi:hypothetical protein
VIANATANQSEQITAFLSATLCLLKQAGF